MNYSISHLSTSDSIGGSANSAKRIHLNLIKQKINSNLFVGSKSSNFQNSYLLSKYKKLRNLDSISDSLFNKFGFQYSFVPSNIFINKKILISDIIQLYNIHGGYFKFSNILKLSKFSKIIWRLSDYWAMTGHCAYPGECDKWKNGCFHCPNLNIYPSIGLDRTKSLWENKKKIIKKIDMKIIVPTKKMFNEVKKSSILKEKEVLIIPNGVDVSTFKPLTNKIARKELSIPNKFSVLFIAHIAFNNNRKGTDYLFEIFKRLEKNPDIQKIIVGFGSKSWKSFGFKNLYTFDFTVNNKMKMKLYNSANCTLIPSEDENLPNVALESMSCGIPVICFNSGGLPEIVNKKSGICTNKKDANYIYDSIIKLKKNKKKELFLSKNSRKTILSNFSEEKEIKNYIRLYENILK